MKWLLRGLAAVTLLVLLVAGALGWLASSETGLRWGAGLARSATDGALQIERPQGALARTMRFERIAYALDGTTIEATGVVVALGLGDLFDRVLAVERLHIDRLVVHLAPGQGTAAASGPTLPASLALPLDMRVERATVGALEIVRGDRTTRVRDIFVSYAGGIHRHQLRSLRADTGFGYVGGAGWIETARPFALDVGIALERPAGATPPASLLDRPAQARVHLDGSLRALSATAHAVLEPMRADVRARLAPFDRPWPDLLESVEARAATLDLAEFAAALPHTAIALEASARGGEQRIRGELHVRNEQAGALDQQRLPIRSVAASFATDLASLRLDGLTIDLEPGGALTGAAELQQDPLTARVEVNATDLDLRALRSSLRATALDGPLRVNVQGPQQQTLDGTLTEADLRIGAHVERNGDRVEITGLQLAARGGSATGRGTVRLEEPLQFESRLAFERFDPARFGAYPEGNLNGEAEAAGSLGAARRIDARWTIARSTLRGRAFASRGRARVVDDRVAQVDASARLGGNEVTANGAFGAKGDRLRFRIDAPALGEVADGLGGRARATGVLSGTPTNPRVEVEADATQLRLPTGVSVQSAQVRGRVGLEPDAPLVIALTAQRVALPQLTLERLTLDTTGSRAQHEAALQAHAGERRLDLQLRGGWTSALPGRWEGELAAARLRGVLPDGAIAQLVHPAPLQVAPEKVALHDLQLEVTDRAAPPAHLRVAELVWQPGTLTTQGTFEHLATRWIGAFVALPAGVETSVKLGGAWSIRASPRIDGTLSVRREDGDLRLAGPPAIDAGLTRLALDARFEASRTRATLDIDGKLATLAAHASIEPAPGAAGVALEAQSPLVFDARLDVGEIRLITDPLQTFARLSGKLQANLQGRGTLGAPRVEGTLAADSLGVIVPPYGVDLQQGQLRAALQGDVLEVTQFTIRGGDGRLTASGVLPLRPAAGRTELQWRADSFRLLNRPDMRLVVSGNGTAGFADREFAFKGTLRAERGHFELARQRLPEPGEDVVVLGEEAPGPEKPPLAMLDLDLQVDLGKELTLRAYGLNGKVTGGVHLTTTEAGELRAKGRVQTADATFRAYGQELVVDPGVLVFDGPIDNPTLQVTAWRRNQQVEAGVQLSGNVQAPRVTLVSEPDVPEGERLSWLVLGRAPGEAAGSDIALLQAAGGALLGGGDSVPVTERVANSLGLDELAIRSSSEIASSVVAVGKRLSDRLVVTYEHGLGAAAENLVKLDYSLTRRISLRAETGTTTGLGVFYRFAWD